MIYGLIVQLPGVGWAGCEVKAESSVLSCPRKEPPSQYKVQKKVKRFLRLRKPVNCKLTKS